MSSGVNTSYSAGNDKELFELCKEVYRRTGWKTQGTAYKRFTTSEDWTIAYDDVYRTVAQWCYLYTSDYLLDKLPRKFKKQGSNYWLEVSPMDLATWGACYADDEDGMEYFNYSDTPLKALLKLVIALDDAKELK